jgi:hypothetical protein
MSDLGEAKEVKSHIQGNVSSWPTENPFDDELFDLDTRKCRLLDLVSTFDETTVTDQQHEIHRSIPNLKINEVIITGVSQINGGPDNSTTTSSLVTIVVHSYSQAKSIEALLYDTDILLIM